MNTLDRYNNKIFAYQYEYSEGNRSNHGDIEYYIKKLKPLNVKTLELACGTGRITIALKKGDINVIGLDHAQAMIDIANEKSKDLNIQYLVNDASSFNLNERFGAIFIAYNSISFIENDRIEIFISNIKKHLMQEGRFLFDIGRTLNDVWDKNNKKYIDWSDEIFIKELNLYLRRRMEMTLLPQENITECKYFWETRDEIGKIEGYETIMNFSNYEAEDYIKILKKNGFELLDKREEKIPKGNLIKIHTFCELKL